MTALKYSLSSAWRWVIKSDANSSTMKTLLRQFISVPDAGKTLKCISSCCYVIDILWIETRSTIFACVLTSLNNLRLYDLQAAGMETKSILCLTLLLSLTLVSAKPRPGHLIHLSSFFFIYFFSGIYTVMLFLEHKVLQKTSIGK